MKKKYFVLAALFLFNPIISIFDILPDFIGYYFLLKAFTPVSYIFDNASDLHGALKKMMIVGVAKFFSVILLFVTDATMALVLSFTFAILEIIYGFGMTVKLFDVTSYIRMRYDDTVSTRQAEKLKRFSLFFLVAKLALASLPDVTALSMGNSSLKVDLSEFRPMLFIISAFIALIIGIIWFIRFTEFFKKAFTDALNERVEREYNEQKTLRPGIFSARDYMFMIKLLTVGIIFSFDINLDSINYFMDGIFSVMCIIAFRSLITKGYIEKGKNEKNLIILCSVHIAVNLANFISSAIYFADGDLWYVYRSMDGFLKYLPIGVLTVVESALFFIIVYKALHLVQHYAVPNIREYQRFFAERSIEGYVEEYEEYSKKYVKNACIFIGISLIYFVFYTFIRPLNENFVLGNYLTAIIAIISVSKALNYISDKVFLTIFKYS